MSRPNTGTASIYDDGDEHNYSREAIRNEQRHHTANVEGYMRKGQNRAMNDMISEDTQAQMKERYRTDPLYRATIHGNEPSAGARIDAEILAEEAEMLKKKREKTDSMPGKKF
ncbi:hypothetical protein NPX13_g2436 [Xylaria arbuscula]|uniref:Uncharacterized protein n=1 Tax=Xylaria arbuscula TaxID=114810 RepID=A0A9W8NKG7_9PEZI|nr:hypothetical protein NPX13_g2436 [Xylaria arbuscula]